MSQPSFYTVIPANVRYDKRLQPRAILLYGEIVALCSVKGYCYASNEYFAANFSVHERNIQRWLNRLQASKHIVLKFNSSRTKRRIYITDKGLSKGVAKMSPPTAKTSLGGGKNVVRGGDENATHNNTYLIGNNNTIEEEREDAHTRAGDSLSHKNGSVATAEFPQLNPVDVWAYEIRNEFPRKGGEFADIDAIKKARTRLIQKGYHSFDADLKIELAVKAYRDYLTIDCLYSESPWNCTTFFEKGYFLDKAAWSKAMESNNRKPEPQQGNDELKQMGVDW